MAAVGMIHVPLAAPELSWIPLWSLASGILALTGSAQSIRRNRNRREQWSALQKLSAMINRSAELRTILSYSLEEVLRITGLEAAAIHLNGKPDASSLSVYRGFSDTVISQLESLPWDLPAGMCRVPNGRQGERHRFRQNDGPGTLHSVLHREGFRILSVHSLNSGDHDLGNLLLVGSRTGTLSSDSREFIDAWIETLATAVVNSRLREQADKLAEDLVALHEVNKIISQSLDFDGIVQRIVIEGRRLVKTSQCHLFLLDERRHRLVGSASTQSHGLRIKDVEIKLSENSTPAQALLQRRVIAEADITPPAPLRPDVMRAMQWRAAIFAPLIAKEQEGLLICSDESAGRIFTGEEISRAETLAHQAVIAMDNAWLFQVLSRSQKEWETTFDAMQDCVSLHDTNGKIMRANAALARRLKTTPPKIIGRYCSEIYNPAELRFSPCRHMDALQSEELVVEEVELPPMGGTFQISVSPWYDKNNRLIGSIHVAKDVSKEKLLQQQLIQSEKLSAIGELIAGIAHELNNPLTGVMGYSQLLQLRKDLDERSRDSLLKINNLALRCQKIVQNLLSFARKQKPERTLSNVNDMLERTVELRNYELSVNNIEIVRNLDRHLPKTIADAHQLQQVFLNIITNAEHAMLQAHGRGRLEIRSRHDAANKRIIVEIVDDGPGIQESHLSRIFDPFFTTKEVGKGTGLGLSLTYGIIKEHGGNIYALSKLGEGSTFVIELPIISKFSDDATIFPQLMPKTLHFDNLVRDKRILIVDDEKYILDFFTEIFKIYPMQVDTACDGRVAMERLIENDYDLVITDFRMPEMSGRDLFQWVKEKKPPLARRMIFITGDTVSSETRSFFESSCSLYLAKPFKIEEVKEVIQQTLEGGA